MDTHTLKIRQNDQIFPKAELMYAAIILLKWKCYNSKIILLVHLLIHSTVDQEILVTMIFGKMVQSVYLFVHFFVNIDFGDVRLLSTYDVIWPDVRHKLCVLFLLC